MRAFLGLPGGGRPCVPEFSVIQLVPALTRPFWWDTGHWPWRGPGCAAWEAVSQWWAPPAPWPAPPRAALRLKLSLTSWRGRMQGHGVLSFTPPRAENVKSVLRGLVPMNPLSAPAYFSRGGGLGGARGTPDSQSTNKLSVISKSQASLEAGVEPACLSPRLGPVNTLSWVDGPPQIHAVES